jgi:hypothetical protein
MEYADAAPDKAFFTDLITRDISLDDAILDLIDNSMDSLIRSRDINLYQDFLSSKQSRIYKALATIRIDYSLREFRIEDDCGGISFSRAKTDIFRFGKPGPGSGSSLSVFGIGMKRALFKIGTKIKIESRSQDSGFRMDLAVDEWLQDKEWRIPIERMPPASKKDIKGTQIAISSIHDEVSAIMQGPAFQNALITSISETYPFYIDRYAKILVNGKEIRGTDLAFGKSESIEPTLEKWNDDGVKAIMICGLLPREHWTVERSGWYLLCNGRVIIHSDRTEMTGWGVTLPQFMPKHRGFLGIVFLNSEHPDDLPWKTTKRNVYTESPVYVRTLKRMAAASRLVIQFQNKLYESHEPDEPKEEYKGYIKELHTESATKRAAEIATEEKPLSGGTFRYRSPTEATRTTSIQIKVRLDQLSKVKKRLGRPDMSNREAGEKIFAYFFDRECQS